MSFLNPLFLFVFAEELSRSFMPLYIKGLAQPFAGLSPEMAMAIPMAVFMAAIALATPYGGRVADRLGTQRVFLLGMVPALLGYVMTGLAYNIADLSLWRAATGIGYAIVTMACQGYISKATAGEKRTGKIEPANAMPNALVHSSDDEECSHNGNWDVDKKSPAP